MSPSTIIRKASIVIRIAASVLTKSTASATSRAAPRSPTTQAGDGSKVPGAARSLRRPRRQVRIGYSPEPLSPPPPSPPVPHGSGSQDVALFNGPALGSAVIRRQFFALRFAAVGDSAHDDLRWGGRLAGVGVTARCLRDRPALRGALRLRRVVLALDLGIVVLGCTRSVLRQAAHDRCRGQLGGARVRQAARCGGWCAAFC